MTPYRRSYWKSVCFLAIAWLGTLSGTMWIASRPDGASPIMLALGVLTLAVLSLPLLGGIIALNRDALQEQSRPYASRTPRESTLPAVLRRTFAALTTSAGAARDLCPGEHVEVRSLAEIVSTLDRSGALDGLPFMPEMIPYCGRRARVHRRVDKLNDWVGKTGMRRVRSTVLLDAWRCDGSGHDGCQAGCQFRWKEAWLRRVPSRSAAFPTLVEDPELREHVQECATRRATDGTERHVCQATQLAAGTTPLRRHHPGHFVRDVVFGNVGAREFLVGVAIASFNWLQRVRGGVVFPFLVLPSRRESPSEDLGLEAGEWVRVKSKRAIEVTLNAESRNRGLYFDVDMLRYCGGTYRVQARVARLMVEQTGLLRQIATPCVILDGVTATGEYMAFNPENENIFWREIWLERATGSEGSS